MQKAKIEYFRKSAISVGHSKVSKPGAGMINAGNTCYLNSTLQALFHTPSFVNYLLGGYHSCNASNCTICAMTKTLRETQTNAVVRPQLVYSKLKRICKHFVHGRQEDAHEFLR